ncbi:MAG: hypothetical protein O8C67_15265 [Candidatus Methanoperedens sp.]|nr:hypothetical protein [Candidatus Methanoperedens sp.]
MSKIIGINTRCYPHEYSELDVLGMETVKISVVLIAGEIGDYAAYIGSGSNEWIAKFGDKLSFEEACIHFPGTLKRELYRN